VLETFRPEFQQAIEEHQRRRKKIEDVYENRMSGVRLNQTRSHQELAERSLVWLAARASASGCMGTTEFKVAQGYNVDAFALCCQQYTPWCNIFGYVEGADNRDVRIIPQQVCSHVFEVKVSRKDFLATFKTSDGKHANRHSPIANFHYLVTNGDVCEISEVPEFWGILMAKGRGLSVVRHPKFNEIEDSTNDAWGHRMLWTLMNQPRLRHLKITQCPNCCEETNP
jgi:hypothetical protein